MACFVNSPSIELIGGVRHQDVELSWLPGTDCVGPGIRVPRIRRGRKFTKNPNWYW